MSVLYLDTEFNGFEGELISLALVSDCGKEFYEVKEFYDAVDPWVDDNVLPKLIKEGLRPLTFKHQFQQFILQFKNPTIICDWHSDAVHFCQLLSGFNYASSLDYPFTLKVIKTPQGEPVMVHNALEDAKILKKWCESNV